MQLYDEIRERLPKAFARYPKSKATAIKLFCIECMGGSARDAIACTTSRCFLWPHRGTGWNNSAVAQGARPADWRERMGTPENAVPVSATARSEESEG